MALDKGYRLCTLCSDDRKYLRDSIYAATKRVRKTKQDYIDENKELRERIKELEDIAG